MRQVIVQVPRGQGEQVLEAARARDGTNMYCTPADSEHGPVDVVSVCVSNDRVDPLLDDLQQLADPRVTLLPSGVIALRPPAEEAPEQVTDVAARSPVEIFLSGLQSVGSWTGFAGYAAAAGVVVWIGLFTNTTYLLTAAMLIAPYASPAMTLAMATARGDRELLWRNLLRYVASLAIAIVIAWGLSIVMGQEVATEQMVQRSMVSSVAVLLPLVAGAAGALNLCQSDRNSLVSGAATGMLIAASLAPPAGVVGMGAAIGEWGMAGSGLFVLALQLVGINLAGAVVFRLYGLAPRGVRYDRGQRWLSWTSWAATAVVLGGLVAWQFSSSPTLLRSTREQRAAAQVQTAVNQSGVARLVEANVRFTRADIPGQNSLLVVVYAQRSDQAGALSDAEIRQRLTHSVKSQLRSAEFNATPLVDVTVLDDEPGAGAGATADAGTR